MGLARRFMLKRNKEFLRVYRKGKTVGSKLLYLAYMPNGSEPIRFGFSVSRKVGNSVQRNRLKRRMRECVRHHLDRFDPSYRYVFTARAGLAEAEYARIEQTMLSLVSKAGLLHDEHHTTA